MTKQQASFGLQDTSKIASVEEYTFEPIKGYPMLQWRGKRPFTSAQYYPAQLKEVHGPVVEGWRSKIYWGDNSQVMSHLLKEYRGKINLIYIDPPFDSKADYKMRLRRRSMDTTNDYGTFEEKQYTDIWVNDEYLQFIYERLILARELLAATGSIYIHCDWHKSHYLRCILDEVFGPNSFRNEVIWKRSSIATNVSTQWRNSHDTLFFYTKSNSNTFYVQYGEFSDSTKNHYTYEDEYGKFQPVPLLASGRTKGETGQPWRGIDPNTIGKDGMHWLKKPTELEELDRQERIYWPEAGGRPRLKYYLSEAKGVYVSDVWDDIFVINSMAREALGYPTQKPEALLERIIKSATKPNGLIFDCFMGSGTTQAVAMKLGRRFIGADINLGAVQITTKRLIRVAQEIEIAPKAQQQVLLPVNEEGGEESGPQEPFIFYTGFEVYDVNHYDIFRNPLEAKDLLLQALEVNRLEASHLFDGEKDGRLWKVMPVNRIATRQDLNELITGFDYRAFDRRQAEHPNQPVEKITLVCMGHEPDLAAVLAKEIEPYKIDVQVVDILRDKQDLQFKREAEARIVIQDGDLVIERFYPMNLLQKLSLQAESVDDWRELVESVMIDWNYDGAVFQPAVVDIPEKEELVGGRYPIAADAGTIRVKITDLLSESLEQEVSYG